MYTNGHSIFYREIQNFENCTQATILSTAILLGTKYEIFKVVPKWSFASWPRNTNFQVALKRPFVFWTFQCHPNKMFKHIQTICRFLPTNCLSMFDHFVGLVLKGLTKILSMILIIWKKTKTKKLSSHLSQVAHENMKKSISFVKVLDFLF